MKRKGRTVAVLSAIVVVGVVLLAFVFWEDLAVNYYVYRMQSDSDFLNEVVGDLESRVKEQAFERFTKNPRAVPMLIQSLHEQRWDAYDAYDAYDGERAPNVAQTLVMIGKSAFPALQEVLEGWSWNGWGRKPMICRPG